MLREVCLDPTRPHFLGKVPYDTYRQILQVSAAHVYLTDPFVLSWSMLEAMADKNTSRLAIYIVMNVIVSIKLVI